VVPDVGWSAFHVTPSSHSRSDPKLNAGHAPESTERMSMPKSAAVIFGPLAADADDDGDAVADGDALFAVAPDDDECEQPETAAAARQAATAAMRRCRIRLFRAGTSRRCRAGRS
jgi:hypothetical protein